MGLPFAHLVLYQAAYDSLVPLTEALHDKMGGRKRPKRRDENGEERVRKSNIKPRPPPESYLSTKWTHSVFLTGVLGTSVS